MLTSIILPLFGLLTIYHTFCTLITYIPNKLLLFLCTVLIISLQIVFVDQIIPYNSQFNTKYLLLLYLYPLWQAYFSTYILPKPMLPSPFLLSSEQRQKRSLTQDVIPFLHNLIFQYTNPHCIHTIPLIIELYESYLYYFRYKTLDNTQSQTPFQITFNPIKKYKYRNILQNNTSTKHYFIYARCLYDLYGQTYRT